MGDAHAHNATANANDDGRIKVHSAELYLELMNAITYVPSAGEQHDDNLLHLGNKKDIQRENFEAKQRVREAEYKTQMEGAKKETQRRVMENQKRKEAQFDNLYGTIKAESGGFVNRVSKMIHAGEERDERRKEKTYDQWNQDVFEPLSERVQTTHIPPQRSPTANDDEAVQYHLPDLEPRNMSARQREVLSATMWDKVEATPHGRYSEQNKRQHCVKRVTREDGVAAATAATAPLPNDYDVPTGDRGQRIRQLESGRGKKITGPLKIAPEPPPRGALPLPPKRGNGNRRGEGPITGQHGYRAAVST